MRVILNWFKSPVVFYRRSKSSCCSLLQFFIVCAAVASYVASVLSLFVPHVHHENLYIVKLGFTGVYIIFLISAQKHRLWYSLEPPRRGGSNENPQSIF